MPVNVCTSGCSIPGSGMRRELSESMTRFAERHGHGIGAEIMGANKFGPPGVAGRSRLEGLVGPKPAVPHTDLRPHPRPQTSIEMQGGTTFQFRDANPTDALQTAREAARGQDLIRPAPPTGPGPVTTSGQVATRHEASHSGGHTRGHQPQPSTFRLRWRSSQSFRRLRRVVSGLQPAGCRSSANGGAFTSTAKGTRDPAGRGDRTSRPDAVSCGQRHGHRRPGAGGVRASVLRRHVPSLVRIQSRAPGTSRVPGESELGTHAGAECHVIGRTGGDIGQPHRRHQPVVQRQHLRGVHRPSLVAVRDVQRPAPPAHVQSPACADEVVELGAPTPCSCADHDVAFHRSTRDGGGARRTSARRHWPGSASAPSGRATRTPRAHRARPPPGRHQG